MVYAMLYSFKPATQVVIIIKLDSIVKSRIMNSYKFNFVLDLFRTFEQITELYVYKHNSLCMFITLIKPTFRLEINYKVG